MSCIVQRTNIEQVLPLVHGGFHYRRIPVTENNSLSLDLHTLHIFCKFFERIIISYGYLSANNILATELWNKLYTGRSMLLKMNVKYISTKFNQFWTYRFVHVLTTRFYHCKLVLYCILDHFLPCFDLRIYGHFFLLQLFK